MEKEKIDRFFDFCINRLESQIRNVRYDHSIVSDLHSKIYFIKNLKEIIQFQRKTILEKQNIRKGWIKSLQKRGKSITIQTASIELYDKIVDVKVYLENKKQLDEFASLLYLCEEEIDLIDFTYVDFGEIHVSKEKYSKLMSSALLSAKKEENVHSIFLQKLIDLQSAFSKIF
jgi:hypothetical protein